MSNEQHRPVGEHRRNQLTHFRSDVRAMQPEWAAILPPQITPKHFARVVLSAASNNPELLECDRKSFLSATMAAAADGVHPDPPYGKFVVFKDKRRGKIVQWLLMVAGVRQKVRNSGEIASWECHLVYERDEFKFQLGDNAHIDHVPVRGNRGEIIAAYSIARFRTGEVSRELMWREDIEAIRRRSRTPDDGPWVTDFGEMAKKTVARRHSKVLPMSTDILGALHRRDDELLDDPAPPVRRVPVEPDRLNDAFDLIAGPDGDGEFAEAEPDPVAEAVGPVEKLRWLQVLNDAAADGQLEETYERLPARWKTELAAAYETLKHPPGA